MRLSVVGRFLVVFCNLLFGGVAVVVLPFLSSCSSSRDLADGEYAVTKVSVVCDNKSVDASTLAGYSRQRPAPRVFGFFKKKGTAAVKYDASLAEESRRDIENAVRNMGFLRARATIDNTFSRKKVRTQYNVTCGAPYYIKSFRHDIRDDSIAALLSQHAEVLSSLSAGRPFSVVELNNVRNATTSLLNDNGYYRFTKDYITFTVDTLSTSTSVDLLMTLDLARGVQDTVSVAHQRYTIGDIRYYSVDDSTLHLRPHVLRNNTMLHSGGLYSSSALRQTYNTFAHLGAVRYTNVSFHERADSAVVDCDIGISTNKPSSLSIQPEGTNTSGDLGAALIVAYTNNNIFRGSEAFRLSARVAYEAIRGLEGYSDQDYQEYNVEGTLTFPRFIAPFRSSRRALYHALYNPTTEVAISYNLQNRPEFHRRLFSASWRYRWSNAARGLSYRLDLLDLNFIYMPWISSTFKEEYLDNNESRNAILRYNYEDLLVMKLGFVLTLSRKHSYLRCNIETAGNFLHALATLTHFPRNEDKQYTLLHIAYAQYVRGDVEYTHTFSFDENNTLVLHAAVGVAYPYGNSRILPFDKRYFSGGANSVRGWTVRSLGPGRFHSSDGKIDFINQTGDMRLDLNAEYRAKLFWKFYGALFIDAGNIWTLRHYDEQEGGQFRFDTFYKELAASYGLGIRLLLGYFTLRFDFGMKAVNPDYTTKKEHFPIYHPRLSRDLAFHFAVGMPF